MHHIAEPGGDNSTPAAVSVVMPDQHVPAVTNNIVAYHQPAAVTAAAPATLPAVAAVAGMCAPQQSVMPAEMLAEAQHVNN